MKRIIFSVVSACIAMGAMAQETATKVQKSPEEVANRQADRLKTSLSLTDEQRTQVYNAALTRITKVREIRAKYPNDKKAANKEIKPVLETFNNSMASILTADQLTKWKEMKAKAKEKAKAKRKAKKAAPATSDDDGDL